MTREFSLLSPLAAWVRPLDQACDPAFAQALLGDGVILEPMEGLLRAPCDGTILTLNDSKHAIVLRSPEGAEILMHFGIDTVALRGRGFTALVEVGDVVTCGTPLLDVDLDAVAEQAPSLQTPMILLNDDRFAIADKVTGCEIRPGDRLMSLVPRGEVAAEALVDEPKVHRPLRVPLRHGLHARPAARIAALARQSETSIRIIHAGQTANAASPSSIMALGVGHGDEIIIEADADEATGILHSIVAMIAEGMGEGADLPASAPPPLADDTPVPPVGNLVRGVTASPGFAVGPLWQRRSEELPAPYDGVGAEAERSRLAAAIAHVRSELQAQVDADSRSVSAQIADAHLALIDDPDLVGPAALLIDEGRGAAFAWRATLSAQRDRMRANANPHMAERAADMEELERRILRQLAGKADDIAFPQGAILCADDIGPADMAALTSQGAAGVVTANGGPTSHAAIIAADLGLPFLVAAGRSILAIPDGTSAILDTHKGELRLSPEPAELEEISAMLSQAAHRRETALLSANLPAQTVDGARIDIFANLGSHADAVHAVEAGAEGCGLLRTEFLFLDRKSPPTEDEQEMAYRAIAAALGDRTLVLRLLDIGGDKPAAYLPRRVEDNPALGLRGIRLGFAEPDLLRAQIRAALRAVPPRQLHIMAPMVSTNGEMTRFREMVDECADAAGITDRPALGVMVETPAAAIMADTLASHCDFLSIGSNDLAQYVLARDRGNPYVAADLDAFDPAVLRFIDIAAKGANTGRCWVGICGGLASEPLAVPLLIGLGLTELSCAIGMVAEVKQIVRSVRLSDCQDLAARVLQCSDRLEAREHCAAFLKEAGL